MSDPVTVAKQVGELIELAEIYLEDGAPLTAADRLEEAAKVCRDWHAEKMARFSQAHGRGGHG